MPKLLKPNTTKKETPVVVPLVTVESLNKPISKVGRPKKKKNTPRNWIGIITVATLIIIAISTTYTAYAIYATRNTQGDTEQTTQHVEAKNTE